MTDPTVLFARLHLDVMQADNAAHAARIAELEAKGHRIVDGGQTGSYDDNGECSWEITEAFGLSVIPLPSGVKAGGTAAFRGQTGQ